MTEAEELRRIAYYDWVCVGQWNRLHMPADLTPDVTNWWVTDVTLVCGLQRNVAHLPGILTRISAPRCAHCCDRFGLPRGRGSPKNDPQCRQILGMKS